MVYLGHVERRIYHPYDGIPCIIRVHSAIHRMTGVYGLEQGLCVFLRSYFSDKHYIRTLSERVYSSAGKE